MTGRSARAGLIGAAAARLSYAALKARPPGGAATWSRTNHRGEAVTLLEGQAAAIGGIVGVLAAGGSRRDRVAVAVAGAGAAAFGSFDDLAGNGASKGFRGHIGALRAGELTTGAVKIAGIGATGLTAALIAGPRADAGRSDRIASGPLAVADTLINAGLVAGGANLVNLFDLRPGRAIKVALLTGGLLAPSQRGRTTAAGPLAAAAALLADDLDERSMLGDGGANALGAMLGAAAAITLPRTARLGALAVIVGLTAASEKVSFTKVIERTAPLRRLDMLGRRPASPATRSAAGTSTAPASTAPASAAPEGAASASPAPEASPVSARPRPADSSPTADGTAPVVPDEADRTLARRDRRSAEAR
jgi:UDP-GlcNAc:undecaprenyl-phosphate/decaprenyl-phosphate GlcNAc-1-phosphate transferase